MTALVLALYAEGASDARFLPVIIRRTVERQLVQHRRFDVDVLDVLVVNHGVKRDHPTQAGRILAAARLTAGYHALLVHLDADAPTAERAFNERFMPGLALVQTAQGPVCRELVPLITIHASEAWMLADAEAFRQVIGSAADPTALQLPTNPRAIEADSDPKATLAHAVQRAFAGRTRRRRHHFAVSSTYELLAQLIRLERLEQLSSYRRFQQDLLLALVAARLVEPSSR